MHDIDRGGNPTAVRLAALAALRNAQADSTLAEEGEAEEAEKRMAHDSHGAHPRKPKSSAQDPNPGNDPEIAHTRGQDVSAGVYAAVEAAVKKSRVEFMARLLEYRRKLDCDAFTAAGPDGPGASLDEAQFVAHRIAGVGKTLGFADLGDTARQAEAAITAYKLESTADLRQAAISRICKLMGLIEATCAEHEDCRA
jgi:HPt (histidine-containing phosphotransfer) domain-containing protein